MAINKNIKENLEYENYTVNNILGSSLITLINKVIDSNNQNDVQKDEKGLYISNDTNSIIIEVKFIERDEVFRMEAISAKGSENFIKFYNTMSFKCMKKQYHENTKSISYLYFESLINDSFLLFQVLHSRLCQLKFWEYY